MWSLGFCPQSLPPTTPRNWQAESKNNHCLFPGENGDDALEWGSKYTSGPTTAGVSSDFSDYQICSKYISQNMVIFHHEPGIGKNKNAPYLIKE